MKIYLDIVYLLNAFIGLLCLLSIGVLFDRTFTFFQLMGMSLLWGLNVAGLYLPGEIVISIVLSIVLSFLIEAHHRLKMVCIWLFLTFTYTTSFICFGDALARYGLILVADTSFSWIFAAILGTIVIGLYLMMLFSLKKKVLKQGLFYQVIIRKAQWTQSYRGFMDTGNQAVCDGLPVIFMNHLEWNKEKMIHIDHVGGEVLYPAVKAEIYFNQTWQPVYLAKMPHLALDEAELLLNLQLF